MFELEGDLCPFLRDAAVFEGIGKLVLLANTHEELRLREKLLEAHTGLLGCGGPRGGIDVGGEVWLAGSLVGVRAGGVMPIRHKRATVAPRKLFVARV